MQHQRVNRVLSEGSERESVTYDLLAPGGLLAIFGIPWLVEASPYLCFPLHIMFSLCAHLCPNFLFVTRTPVILD